MKILILLLVAAVLLDVAVLSLSLHLRRFFPGAAVPPFVLTALSVFLLFFPPSLTISTAALMLLFASLSLILSGEGKRGKVSSALSFLPVLTSFTLFIDNTGKWAVLFPSFALLLFRLLPALGRLRCIPESDPGIDFYGFSVYCSGNIVELVWFFLVLLSLSGGGALSFPLSFILALYLVFRLCYGSPFFFSPVLDGKIHSASMPRREDPSGKGDSLESGRLLYLRCRKYMEEKKPFLVESFCLRDLASALATNTGYLSRVINRETGLNFRRFVNGYRVKYSMEIFHRSPGIPVSDLASLSGFATCSTYYTAFQQLCHESPGSWCRRERRRLLGNEEG